MEIKTTSKKRESFEDQRIRPRKASNDLEMRASLKMGVQLGKLTQVVMVILMEMGDQLKAENHPARGRNHLMGLEK